MRKAFLFALITVVLFTTKSQAQYEIMVSNNYPPYNFIDEKGELTGFNVDLLNAIIEIYKAEIHISHSNWETINRSLETGKIHAIAGTHYPESPDNKYFYTRSSINTSHCFLFKSGKLNNLTLEAFRSFKNPVIGMYKNDVLIYYILSINPTTRFLFFDNYHNLINSLENEEIMCAFVKRVGGMYYAKNLGYNQIVATDHRILERNMGFKVSKSAPELAKMLNNGMEIVLANGTYEKIYNKWILKYDQPYNKWENHLWNLVVVSIIILIFALGLFIFNRILRNRVVVKTNDLRKQLDINSAMMQELEIQKNKAEESDKMKSAFLANMSHEIRTPMNGIIGFAELIKSEDFSKEEQAQFLDVILRSGNRMLGTINNIIEVAKLESGVEQAQYQKTQLENILKELKDFFSSEAEKKGIDLIFKVQKENPLSFYTDEYKVNAIFTNLIKNAIKFTDKGFVKVSLNISKEKFVFVVEDSGIGIPKEKHKKVFDQFVQADSSHSNGYQGSGLGLSICRGYVKLLNGKMELSSEPGKGTRFVVVIPNNELAS